MRAVAIAIQSDESGRLSFNRLPLHRFALFGRQRLLRIAGVGIEGWRDTPFDQCVWRCRRKVSFPGSGRSFADLEIGKIRGADQVCQSNLSLLDPALQIV